MIKQARCSEQHQPEPLGPAPGERAGPGHPGSDRILVPRAPLWSQTGPRPGGRGPGCLDERAAATACPGNLPSKAGLMRFGVPAACRPSE